MFNESKYTNVYFSIIDHRRLNPTTEYFEKHHIIPRSLGGDNSDFNVVKLTAREHFICHLLLIRMVSDDSRRKMIYAAWQQSRPSKHKNVKVTSRVYETLRIQLSQSYSGVKRAPFSAEWKANMSKRATGEKNNMFGKNHSVDTKTKISENRKGKCLGTENPFFGKKHSLDTITKIKEVNARDHVCPYCGKSGQSNSMKRWHFENCKIKQ